MNPKEGGGGEGAVAEFGVHRRCAVVVAAAVDDDVAVAVDGAWCRCMSLNLILETCSENRK